jgi:hypothetical protein
MRIAPDEQLDRGMLAEQIHKFINKLPSGMRLVLILDEIGEVLPTPPDYEQASFPDWREFLAFLRWFHFKSGRRFVLGVAAYRDDITSNDFGDPDRNPWLRQIESVVPVGPLDRVDCDRMVQDIGAMTGVYYTAEALSHLFTNTGGHPQITRELCAELTEQVEPRPYVIEAVDINRLVAKYVNLSKTTRALYEGLHPKEKQVVDQLARSEKTMISDRELYSSVRQAFSGAGDFRDRISRLIEYGLIGEQTEGSSRSLYLRFGLFRRYLTDLIQLEGDL